MDFWPETMGGFLPHKTVTGWWFGTMEFYDFPSIGNSKPN
jgi:hypothetical protein